MQFHPFTTIAVLVENGHDTEVRRQFLTRDAAIDAADRAVTCCADVRRAYVYQVKFKNGRTVETPIYETPPWD
jgi:hypothetical protein